MTSIFVNIPTSDLERSKAFYTALGTDINPLFTDDNAACIVWDDNVFFMVLTKEYFASFTDKQVVDPKTHAHVAHRAEPRLARGRRQGHRGRASPTAAPSPRPAQDLGFMYSRDLEDPDGNGIQFTYMEPAAVEKGPEAYLAEQAQV